MILLFGCFYFISFIFGLNSFYCCCLVFWYTFFPLLSNEFIDIARGVMMSLLLSYHHGVMVGHLLPILYKFLSALHFFSSSSHYITLITNVARVTANNVVPLLFVMYHLICKRRRWFRIVFYFHRCSTPFFHICYAFFSFVHLKVYTKMQKMYTCYRWHTSSSSERFCILVMDLRNWVKIF